MVNKSRTFSLINILCACVVFFSSPGPKAVNGILNTCLSLLFCSVFLSSVCRDSDQEERHHKLSIYLLLLDTLHFLSSPHFQGAVIFHLPATVLQWISPACRLWHHPRFKELKTKGNARKRQRARERRISGKL